jgi:hypothetical protein
LELGSIDLKDANANSDWNVTLNRLTEAVGGTLAWSLAGEFWQELSVEEQASLKPLLDDLDGPIAVFLLSVYNDRTETRHEHVLGAIDRTVANFKRAAALQSEQGAGLDEPKSPRDPSGSD